MLHASHAHHTSALRLAFPDPNAPLQQQHQEEDSSDQLGEEQTNSTRQQQQSQQQQEQPQQEQPQQEQAQQEQPQQPQQEQQQQQSTGSGGQRASPPSGLPLSRSFLEFLDIMKDAGPASTAEQPDVSAGDSSSSKAARSSGSSPPSGQQRQQQRRQQQPRLPSLGADQQAAQQTGAQQVGSPAAAAASVAPRAIVSAMQPETRVVALEMMALKRICLELAGDAISAASRAWVSRTSLVCADGGCKLAKVAGWVRSMRASSVVAAQPGVSMWRAELPPQGVRPCRACHLRCAAEVLQADGQRGLDSNPASHGAAAAWR